ncbi:hypothetical protein RN001_003728 [Aquatica leii]|uniref:Uncharacterized protein n=1 Tax=Aquatica leii TaxID=1421715 RepID=A0AAN7PIR9_9COLE|nr:hypothetical protein RN001_003728 [Aquatica leii]
MAKTELKLSQPRKNIKIYLKQIAIARWKSVLRSKSSDNLTDVSILQDSSKADSQIFVDENKHNPVVNSNELHYDTGESELENQSIHSIYTSNNESDSSLVESEDDNNHLYCELDVSTEIPFSVTGRRIVNISYFLEQLKCIVMRRTTEQLRKCWENMKSRRKKQLAIGKVNRMATGGGLYTPTVDDDNAIVDDILNAVDIEIKDSIDSDTITIVGVSEENTQEYVLDKDSMLMPVGTEEEVKDVPSTSEDKAHKKHAKSAFLTRGTAIERELESRIARTQKACEQDEELHLLKLEEQRIRIEIAKEILKQEKIKTQKLE